MPSIFSHPDTRVMTYNIKNGGDILHWEQRKAVLAETIRQQNPTILGIQEGFEFQLAYLRDELQHYEIVGEGRDPILGDEYCAVFVNTRMAVVEETGTFWLSETPDTPGSKSANETLPRIATWVRLQVHGTPLLFVNTHFTYVEEGIPVQMAVLVDRVRHLTDLSVETVIVGDFNIGRHREPMNALRELGFEDAWTLAAEATGPIFTTPVWDLWDDQALDAVLDENRIDWVCIRPPDGEQTPLIRVETLQTHRTEPVPSDHFPVVVTAVTES